MATEAQRFEAWFEDYFGEAPKRSLHRDGTYASPEQAHLCWLAWEIRASMDHRVPRCWWTRDSDGVYRTCGGGSWEYSDGEAPVDHGQLFCHRCGGKIELVDSEEPSPDASASGVDEVREQVPESQGVGQSNPADGRC